MAGCFQNEECQRLGANTSSAPAHRQTARQEASEGRLVHALPQSHRTTQRQRATRVPWRHMAATHVFHVPGRAALFYTLFWVHAERSALLDTPHPQTSTPSADARQHSAPHSREFPSHLHAARPHLACTAQVQRRISGTSLYEKRQQTAACAALTPPCWPQCRPPA